MDAPSIAALTTVAGITVVTWALMYVVVRAAAFTQATLDRFGPLLAVGIAVVVAVLAVVVGIVNPGRADFGQAIVNGLFAGLAAIGVNEVGKSVQVTPAK